MSYLGSWAIDDNLTFACNTHTPATGAATDADAVPAYRVYEDETAAAILTGNMALLDDANTTGFYSEQIALTVANGFEVGKCYTIYISAAVGGVTGTVSHTFQMQAEVNVAAVEGADPTDTIRDAVVDDATRIDGSAINALTGVANISSLVVDAAGNVAADVVEISGDATAANNLEAILDGTGATATFSQIRVAANVAQGAIDITNSNNFGYGVRIVESGDGDGVYIYSDGASGIYVDAATQGAYITGNRNAVAGRASLQIIDQGGNGRGLRVDGGDGYPAVHLVGGTGGNALKAEATSADVIHLDQTGSATACGILITSDGTGIWVTADADNALELTASGTNGVYITAAQRGIYVEGGSQPTIDLQGTASGKATLHIEHYSNVGDAVLIKNTNGDGVEFDTTSGLDVNGDVLAPDVITSAKYDESTAFPLKATDSGATYIARTGADSDTLETLSDQIDSLPTTAQVNAEVDAALADIDLDHFIQVTAGSEEPTDGSYLDQIMHKDGNQTFSATTDSLEAISDKLTKSGAAGTLTTGELTVIRGDTYDSDADSAIEGLGDISARSSLWIVVKKTANQTDSESAIFAEETDGITILNGSAYATAAHSVITVTDENAGDLTWTLDEAVTDDLVPGLYYYDIQTLDSSGNVKTWRRMAQFTVTADIARVIV